MTNKTSFLKLAMATCVMALSFSLSMAGTTPAPKQAKNKSSKAAKWNYIRKVDVDNSDFAVNDAVVQIQFNAEIFDYSKAATNGADIRITNGSGPTSKGLPFWIEEWNNNGLSTIWVKIPKLSNGKNTLSMFYGNPEAKSAADGNATFLFFDDFESGDYTKKWTNVSVGQVMEKNGMLKLSETDGEVGQITANFDITDKVVIRTTYQRERGDEHWTSAGVGGWNRWFCFGDFTEVDGTGTNWLMFYFGDGINQLKTKPEIKGANGVINDKWRKVAFWNDGEKINGRQDETTISWTTLPTGKFSSKLALRTLDNDSWDNFSYISVSPYLNSKLLAITVGLEKKN